MKHVLLFGLGIALFLAIVYFAKGSGSPSPQEEEGDPRLFKTCPINHYCLNIVTKEKIYPQKGQQVRCKLYNKCIPIPYGEVPKDSN